MFNYLFVGVLECFERVFAPAECLAGSCAMCRDVCVMSGVQAAGRKITATVLQQRRRAVTVRAVRSAEFEINHCGIKVRFKEVQSKLVSGVLPNYMMCSFLHNFFMRVYRESSIIVEEQSYVRVLCLMCPF